MAMHGPTSRLLIKLRIMINSILSVSGVQRKNKKQKLCINCEQCRTLAKYVKKNSSLIVSTQRQSVLTFWYISLQLFSLILIFEQKYNHDI